MTSRAHLLLVCLALLLACLEAQKTLGEIPQKTLGEIRNGLVYMVGEMKKSASCQLLGERKEKLSDHQKELDAILKSIIQPEKSKIKEPTKDDNDKYYTANLLRGKYSSLMDYLHEGDRYLAEFYYKNMTFVDYFQNDFDYQIIKRWDKSDDTGYISVKRMKELSLKQTFPKIFEETMLSAVHMKKMKPEKKLSDFIKQLDAMLKRDKTILVEWRRDETDLTRFNYEVELFMITLLQKIIVSLLRFIASHFDYGSRGHEYPQPAAAYFIDFKDECLNGDDFKILQIYSEISKLGYENPIKATRYFRFENPFLLEQLWLTQLENITNYIKNRVAETKDYVIEYDEKTRKVLAQVKPEFEDLKAKFEKYINGEN